MQLSRRKESQRNRTEELTTDFFYSLLSDSQIAQQGVNMTKNERTFDFTETIVSESSLCHGKILKYKKKTIKRNFLRDLWQT